MPGFSDYVPNPIKNTVYVVSKVNKGIITNGPLLKTRLEAQESAEIGDMILTVDTYIVAVETKME